MFDSFGQWGSATEHKRYIDPIAKGIRRKCRCGCGRWATHVGKANGVALTMGCELLVRRWVRDWRNAYPKKHPPAVGG